MLELLFLTEDICSSSHRGFSDCAAALPQGLQHGHSRENLVAH